MRYTEAQLSSEALDQPEFDGQPRKIIICSTPRSGSYMLCRYMVNAGLGVPHEYFNPVIMREIAPRLGLGESIAALKWRPISLRDRLPFRLPDRVAEERVLAAYIARLVPRRCQRGIFAAKIHFDQYFKVLDNPTGRKLLDGALFIHLFREDLLRQTVSRNFSYVTGRWGDDDAVTTAPMPQGDLLTPAGIDREMLILAEEDREWRVLLARNGLAPLTISYERLCDDPPAFIATIAERLGIDPRTLRQGYSEAPPPRQEDAPALPSKAEVARRYVAAVRVLRAAVPAEGAAAGAAAAAPEVAAP
jgi:LPS sulfotransferase NodH